MKYYSPGNNWQDSLHIFMHPSAFKLYSFISRSDPSKANLSIKNPVEQIIAACDNCKSYKSSPLRFKAAIPSDQILFSQIISVDFLWLYDKPVLHVIDKQTGFGNASFVKSKYVKDIFNSFMWCWVSKYIGFPSKIQSDQDSAVTSEQFRNYA